MGRFKRLNIEEARENFQLLNEEARKALKGGCMQCEKWRKEYPGIQIYSQDEYYYMCDEGIWETGAVCGIGLSVETCSNPDDVSYCDKHMWPIPYRDCDYCYFESLSFCYIHGEYVGKGGWCSVCYENGVYDYYEYDTYYDDSDNSWDKDWVGDKIRDGMLKDQSVAQSLFTNYWEGKGDMELKQEQFAEVADIAIKKDVDYKSGTEVVVDGKNYYKVQVSFYGTDLAKAFGTATLYYDQSGSIVGMKDQYDFNSMPLKVRDFVSECQTRVMGYVGDYYGAKDFNVILERKSNSLK